MNGGEKEMNLSDEEMVEVAKREQEDGVVDQDTAGTAAQIEAHRTEPRR